MALIDQLKDQVSFLFQDAGDSIFSIQGTGLAALTVDTVDSEAHEWSNEISQYPVEGMEDISDNIKPKPDDLRVTCFVSNTPVHGLIDEVQNFADRFLNGRKRTQDCYNQLKALKALRVPVTVATRYQVYTSMGIQSITVRRVPDEGDALVFDIVFREVNIVKTQTAQEPPGLGASGKQADNATKQRAGVKTDAGKSTGTVTKPADAPKPIKTSILKASGSIFNF